jgi:hypothetical protein
MSLLLTVLLTHGNTYKKNLDYIGKSFHLDEIIRVELMRKLHKSIYCTSVIFLIFEYGQNNKSYDQLSLGNNDYCK